MITQNYNEDCLETMARMPDTNKGYIIVKEKIK